MTVALWLPLMAPVEMLNEAVAMPAVMVMEAGTVRAALVLLIDTRAPPAGAAPLKVTVQLVEELAARLVELQPNDDTVTAAGAVRLMVTLFDTAL